MQVITNPRKEVWPDILARPALQLSELRRKLVPVLEAVRNEGDSALRRFTQQFDTCLIENFKPTAAEREKAAAQINPQLKEAIGLAVQNIRKFHQAQLQKSSVIETMPGVRCWRRQVPIQSVGLYVPGGTAPLFSTLLMLAIPARLAGCDKIVVCTPPDKTGSLDPALLYCAGLLQIENVFKAGGAQAISAMAYGTETIPKVDKIFGPGNQYVTAAKQLVSLDGTAIDMPAGPSEVLVIADDSADPEFVATDLLSQAEHGPDSRVLLLTTDDSLPGRVTKAIERYLDTLPRADIARRALEHSKIVIFDHIDQTVQMANQYAAEHLIIATKNPQELAARILNAGSVFLGHLTPESAGDYASGTNHTLPTNGYARNYSGVSVDSFMKMITFQSIDEAGLKSIGPAIQTLASAEQLQAHELAVRVRLEYLRDKDND